MISAGVDHRLEVPLDPQSLARIAFDAMDDRQATDLVILDIRPVSLLTEFFVIGTADNERQMRAVTDAAIDALREQAGVKPVARDGEPHSGWMLVDFGDLIIHVFDAERRAYYDLESLWNEAPLVARMA